MGSRDFIEYSSNERETDMTNKELIDKLKTFPPDAEVIINWEDFACSEIEDITYADNVVYILHDMT